MLLVPASISTTLAQDSEIPAWIKNNAGWWAEGQIDDPTFVRGIEYLLDSLIIEIPSNQKFSEHGILKLNSHDYELPTRPNVINAEIFGKFSEEKVGTSITMKLTKPDGKIAKENIRMSKDDAFFNYQYVIRSDSPIGEYQISISAMGDIQLGPVTFTITAKSGEEKTIPIWIKNTAGWWATSIISDTEFVNALQFLVKEGIIKVEQKTEGAIKGMDPDLLVYRTKLIKIDDKIVGNKLIKTIPFTAVVVYSTQEQYCSVEEKRTTLAYAKMSEYLLNKLPRQDQPTEIIAVCMELHEIVENTYPFTLKELGISGAHMIIYLGGLEANLESYEDKSAVGWWSISCSDNDYGSCGSNQIVVCDECRLIGTFDSDDPPVNTRDFEDPIANGMWTLSHEIGHSNHYERSGDGGYFDGAAFRNAFITSIHDNQKAFDYCRQQDLLENELCKKLYETVKINNKNYLVMDINYAINNWRDEQKDVMEAIEDLVGTGASVEGFNKITYTEDFEKDDAGNGVGKDIFSIEYPDSWVTDDYQYNWWYYYGNGTTDPKDQVSDFHHEFQTDKALLKFGVWLNKSQACTDCPEGYESSRSMADVDVFFFENIDYAGKSDEKILDTVEEIEWEWCANSSFSTNRMECLYFQVIEKSVYQTDEGRNAYTVEYEFTKFWNDPTVAAGLAIKKEPKVYIASEIHDGNDAWHITITTDKDAFDENTDQFYHFIESFRLCEVNGGCSTPISTVTTPTTPEPIPEPTPEPVTPEPVTPPETSGLPYFGAIVELDKIYYSSEDDVNIVIVAPNFNANPNVIEYIGTDTDSRVTITTSKGTLDFYKLRETGPDTGVFGGAIYLTDQDYTGTSGTGPWSGKIKVDNKDTITVKFSNTYSGKVDTAIAQGFVE